MRIRALPLFTLLLLTLATGWAFIQTRGGVASSLVIQHEPVGVMGTNCNLVLVTHRHRADQAEQALTAAESELRRLEALLSTWIEASPISRFNAAGSQEQIETPRELQEILTLARELHATTHGAFDITARPLIELWRASADRGITPDSETLLAAREASGWDQIQLSEGIASKSLDTTRVDIDGIAKGHAIDLAVGVLRRANAAGGMVEVGGDLRVFGSGPEDKPWTVAIRSPFADHPWAEIEIEKGAVCSSGNYARYVEIDGHRYSHIIDPRSGWPTTQTQAVTVVGPDAATADAWATALSVLGVAGLETLAPELQAMVVTGASDDYQVHTTPGFRQLLVRAAFDLEE